MLRQININRRQGVLHGERNLKFTRLKFSLPNLLLQPSDVIPVGKKKDGSYTGYSKVASSEQFNVIRTYTRKKVREIGEGIFSGNVKISPFQRDGATACAYCEYQGICGFDQKIQGYEYRKLKGMDTELLMKVMQETAQRDQKE